MGIMIAAVKAGGITSRNLIAVTTHVQTHNEAHAQGRLRHAPTRLRCSASVVLIGRQKMMDTMKQKMRFQNQWVVRQQMDQLMKQATVQHCCQPHTTVPRHQISSVPRSHHAVGVCQVMTRTIFQERPHDAPEHKDEGHFDDFRLLSHPTNQPNRFIRVRVILYRNLQDHSPKSIDHSGQLESIFCVPRPSRALARAQARQRPRAYALTTMAIVQMPWQ